MTAAFVYLYNDVWADSIAERIAFGDRSYKQLAKNTSDAADYTAAASAFTSWNQPVSKFFGAMSMFFTYQANYYKYQAGEFNKESMIMDVITTHTKYCENPIGEFFYDQAFTKGGPIIFEYGDKQ